MKREILSAAIRVTVPVLMGYLAIGMAFGLMLQSVGYGAPWALLMSLTIYAGSGQYLGVSLLATGASLPQVAFLTLMINFRHLVYGLSMLEKFRGMGKRKFYMIFINLIGCLINNIIFVIITNFYDIFKVFLITSINI